jgi:AcrR family transcriptional regulator
MCSSSGVVRNRVVIVTPAGQATGFTPRHSRNLTAVTHPSISHRYDKFGFAHHPRINRSRSRPGRCSPSLESAIVQPDTASDDDRGCIIDAAYSCLSAPHSGPIPVAAILQRAGVSTRAFYRHFQSKDELFLAMLRQESDALADRLDRIVDEVPGAPIDQLKAWIGQMFGWMHDAEMRMHLTVIDSDEVRTAKGYRETRERLHADRERSLVEILRRGRADGSFPLADPEHDAVAISAVISREMVNQSPGDEERLRRSLDWVLEFALRALGAEGAAADPR